MESLGHGVRIGRVQLDEQLRSCAQVPHGLRRAAEGKQRLAEPVLRMGLVVAVADPPGELERGAAPWPR